eukprot:4632303-Prymnesium_polylepis.1
MARVCFPRVCWARGCDVYTSGAARNLGLIDARRSLRKCASAHAVSVLCQAPRPVWYSVG